MTCPLVSVLLPVYNGERYLRDAIESILSQTYTHFELIVVDDGSTDDTSQIIASCARRDARIRAFEQPNQGLIATLNRGIELAQGEYLARIDADDIALPERLAKQVAFLAQQPEVGIVGTALVIVDAQGRRVLVKRLPDSDLQIRWLSLLACPFAHPAVMIRRALLLEQNLRYDPEFIHVEDFELWSRLLCHTRGANLQEPLIKYRVNPFGVSVKNHAIQMQHHDRVTQHTIHEYLPDFSIAPEDLCALRELLVGGDDRSPDLSDRIASLAHTYLDMFDAFARYYADNPELVQVRHDVIENAARILFRYPFAPGTRNAGVRLARLDPTAALFLSTNVPGVFYRRLRRTR